MASPLYVFDTNILINLQRRQPLDLYPTLWDKLSGLVSNGLIISSREVLDEITTGSDTLVAWAKLHKEAFLPTDEAVQQKARSILAANRGLVEGGKKNNSADPFVIAIAILMKCKVVTEEGKNGNPNAPQIPDVCDKYRILHINFVEFMRETGIMV
jgi:hypothetical protein